MIKNTLNPIQTTEKIGKNIHRRIRTQYNIRRKKPNIQNLELAEEQESKQTLEDPQNIDKLKKFLIDLQSTSLVDNLNAVIIFGSQNYAIAQAVTQNPDIKMTEITNKIVNILETYPQELIALLKQLQNEQVIEFYRNSEISPLDFKDQLASINKKVTPKIFDPIQPDGEAAKVGDPYSIDTLDQMLAELRDPNFRNRLRELYGLSEKKYEDLGRSELEPIVIPYEITREMKTFLRQYENEVVTILKQDKNIKVITLLLMTDLATPSFKAKIAKITKSKYTITKKENQQAITPEQNTLDKKDQIAPLDYKPITNIEKKPLLESVEKIKNTAKSKKSTIYSTTHNSNVSLDKKQEKPPITPNLTQRTQINMPPINQNIRPVIFKEVNSSPDGQQINKQSPQTPIIKEEAKTEQIKNDLANDRNKKKAIDAAIYVASNYERLPLISYIEMEKNLIKTLSENEAQMMRVLKENQNVKALDFIADNKHIPAKIRKKAHEIVTEIRKQLGLEKKIKKTKIIRYGQSLRYINRTHHARA